MAENINNTAFIEADLISELSRLAEQTKQQANSSSVLLFWEIGFKINETILDKKLSENARQIVTALSLELTDKFGSNFEEKNLRTMMRFADEFADKEIVARLSRQLRWSHFLAILPINNTEAKLFYANQIKDLLMSVNDLGEQIAAKTFKRTETGKY